MNVLKKLKLNILQMDSMLSINDNFDIIKRNLNIGDKNVCIYYVDGFLKDGNMQDELKFMLLIPPEKMGNVKTAQDFVTSFMTYPEITYEKEFEQIVIKVLSGNVAVFIDDIDECILIDVREYPQRQIEEPDKDKVLRGAKDGFIETPIGNISLIRRRIRSPNLRVEYMSKGSVTNNDVVLCYMTDKVDQKTLKILKDKLNKIDVDSLVMGSQSLIEALVKKKWYNPFPKCKYTSRPDVAAANILEGRIILIVDNTPSAIILPTYFIDFFEEAEDYYFLPSTGTYLKITRIFIFLITLLITPLWMLAVSNIEALPQWLSFLKIQEMNSIPIFIQLLMLEFVINFIKAASINTPSMISSSIALIGTIILGDIAIVSKIIVPEVMLITAISTLGYYSQSSYELGYAIKYSRIFLIILVAMFGIYGLIGGLVVILLLIGFNKTITNQSYLYPLIPFNFHDFKRIFLRRKNS